MISPKEEESLIWWGEESKAQEFSVQKAYSLINSNPKYQRCPLWEKVWTKGLIPNIACFTWAATQRKILTQDILQKKGIALPHRCIMCYKAEESLDHLLVQCPYAQLIWKTFASKLGLQWTPLDSLEQLLICWTPLEAKIPSKEYGISLSLISVELSRRKGMREFLIATT